MSAAPKRRITDDELCALQALAQVGFLPASWDKRFNRDVLQPARNTMELSDKAIAQMWRLFIRYRRQIDSKVKARLMKQAVEKSAPDFRKQQAALNEQAKIDKMRQQYQEAMDVKV